MSSFKRRRGIELRTAKKVLRNPSISVSGLILFFFAMIALLAPLIAPHDPLAINTFNALKSPSKEHLLGTDQLGRDILSRIIYGTRLTLGAGVTVVGTALVVGTVLGALAGFAGPVVDNLVMRISDVFLSFPSLVLALSIAAALGPSLINVVIALSAVWWPWYARVVRGQVLSVKGNIYIEAEKAIGASSGRILFLHILPNCISPVIVLASLDLGNAVLAAAGLSFIGVGAQPPSPEWGAMLSEARSYVSSAWWYPTFPGLALFLAVLAFNLFGDGLRDIMDPRWRR